jgi:hypothetical protein
MYEVRTSPDLQMHAILVKLGGCRIGYLAKNIDCEAYQKCFARV